MIAEILLGAGGLTSLASTIYFAVKYASEVRHAAAVEVAQAHVEGEQTRLMFENDVLRDQLDLANRRADALQEVLNEEANSNGDLPRDAVMPRLVRFAQATAAARRASDAVVPEAAAAPASPVAAVLAGIATVR